MQRPDHVLYELERRFTSVVERLAEKRANWQEAKITTAVLAELAMFQQFGMLGADGLHREINVDPYEQEDVAETCYGDIAIVVGVNTQQDGLLQGIAFFEAKRRHDDGRFRFEDGQLQKQLRNTPFHSVLYYNDRKRDTADTGLRDAPEQSAVVVAPSAAAMLARNNEPLTLLTAFSGHIIRRMLLGFDLELRPMKVKEALAAGARWYVHLRAGVDRNIDVARRLSEQVQRPEYLSDRVKSMWETNEYLIALARQRGVQLPPEYRKVQQDELEIDEDGQRRDRDAGNER